MGHFVLAIDISKFISPEVFKRIAGDICRTLRNSKKAPGQERIYTAGEKEYYMEIELSKKGIPINRSIQNDLIIMKEELGLNQYEFPF